MCNANEVKGPSFIPACPASAHLHLWCQAEASAAQMDLVLELLESADRVSGDLEYSTDLFARSTMSRMAAHFQVGADSRACALQLCSACVAKHAPYGCVTMYIWLQALLESIVAAPNAPIHGLSMMTRSERQLVLHTFNNSSADVPAAAHPACESGTIHGMLAYWATGNAPRTGCEVCGELAAAYCAWVQPVTCRRTCSTRRAV